MNSHCIPFRQIPHTTRLFLDFLDFSPSVQQFYPCNPHFLSWAQEESSRIQYPTDRRTQVAHIFDRQNQSWGASAKTIENISRFRAGACAVVTGQQVGLFGGPMFSIYKALTAVKLAEEARKLGLDCVPVFWLATEDHDLDEVNQVRIPDPQGNVHRLTCAIQAESDVPVGSLRLGPEISATVLSAATLLGESESATLLRETYASGETFGTAFAKLFAKLFGDLGVILLDGSDPALDQLAAPLYHNAIEHVADLNRLLVQRGEQLQAAGYHQQVRVTASSTLFFLMRGGARVPVHAESAGFLTGDEKVSKDDLLTLASSSPQSFSPNVLLRPVIQDFLLPTLAYVGGSSEVAYFAQAAIVYGKLLGRVTPIIPRFSATIIDTKLQALLEKHKLSFPDVFHAPAELREKIGGHLLPPNLQASFDHAAAVVERSMAAVGESLAQLDKTLVESARIAESKMLYQITNLHARAARAELRQSEVVGRHAELLANSLYPEKTLQERQLAGAYFLAKHGRELLHQLLEIIHPDCLDHQFITL